jgi:hypothetical protein
MRLSQAWRLNPTITEFMSNSPQVEAKRFMNADENKIKLADESRLYMTLAGLVS